MTVLKIHMYNELMEHDVCVCNLLPSTPLYLRSLFISIHIFVRLSLHSLDRRILCVFRNIILNETGWPRRKSMIGHVFCSMASGPPEVASSALLAAMFAVALIVGPLTPASRYPRIPHSGVVTHSLRVTRTRVGWQECSIMFEHLDVVSVPSRVNEAQESFVCLLRRTGSCSS